MKNRNQYIYKKHILKLSVSTFALGSLLAIMGCNNSLVDTQPIKAADNKLIVSKSENPAIPKTDKGYIAADDSTSTPEGVKKVVDANNQFAIAMYQQINSQPKQADTNVSFSPYSLSTAMAILYVAAEGETRQQIQQTLYYPSQDMFNPNSAALYNQFNKPNSDYKLSTVNDLWIAQGRQINQNFLDTIKRYYGSQATELDFKNDSESSRQTINKAISKNTNQMIPELLPRGSIKSVTTAVLTNAVYFKADWRSRFWSSYDQPFYNRNGTTSKVSMMFQNFLFDYSEDEQVQVVQLPYEGNTLSMLVILPKSKDKLAMQTLIKDLSLDQINEWTKRLKQKDINLNFPKFKIDASYQMKTLLAEMGMPIAFSDQAEFNLFDDRSPIAIDDVYHQAVINVDETGTEAAAATAPVSVDISGPMYPPIEFKADHPFIFMIKDNKTDAILFLGQVDKL